MPNLHTANSWKDETRDGGWSARADAFPAIYTLQIWPDTFIQLSKGGGGGKILNQVFGWPVWGSQKRCNLDRLIGWFSSGNAKDLSMVLDLSVASMGSPPVFEFLPWQTSVALLWWRVVTVEDFAKLETLDFKKSYCLWGPYEARQTCLALTLGRGAHSRQYSTFVLVWRARVCVLLCFVKPILGNRYGTGVSSRMSKGGRREEMLFIGIQMEDQVWSLADAPTIENSWRTSLPCPPLNNLGCQETHPSP